MSWRNWSDDEDLMLDIGQVHRPEPHEVQVLAAARAIHAWRTADVDRELAELTFDSYHDAMAPIRGPISGAPRHLVFSLGEVRVEVELSDTGIEGQLIPPGSGRVWLMDASGPIAETVADEVGCFTFPAGRHGPIRIECAVSGRRLATEWISA